MSAIRILPPSPGKDKVATIPGTTRLENPKADLGAHEIQLSDRVTGDRYGERGMSIIDA